MIINLHSCQLSWNGQDSPGILGLVPVASQLRQNTYNVLGLSELTLASTNSYPMNAVNFKPFVNDLAGVAIEFLF